MAVAKKFLKALQSLLDEGRKKEFLEDIQFMLDEDKKSESLDKLEAALGLLTEEERPDYGVQELKALEESIRDYRGIQQKGLTPEEYQQEKEDAWNGIEEALGELAVEEAEPEVKPKPEAEPEPEEEEPEAKPPPAPALAVGIPAFEIPEKPGRGAAQKLIQHLRTLVELGEESPPVKAELERLFDGVEGWVGEAQEALSEEEDKAAPDPNREERLEDLVKALEDISRPLDDQNIKGAIDALETAFPPRPKRPPAPTVPEEPEPEPEPEPTPSRRRPPRKGAPPPPTIRLVPTAGGFTRPFGCGEFIKAFLSGRGSDYPYRTLTIDPARGAVIDDIRAAYKGALQRYYAEDLVGEALEKKITLTFEEALERIPQKLTKMRSHSFHKYWHHLKLLGWVEPTGEEEESQMGGVPGARTEPLTGGRALLEAPQPRRYYRLSAIGWGATDEEWSDPVQALYQYAPEKRQGKKLRRFRAGSLPRASRR